MVIYGQAHQSKGMDYCVILANVNICVHKESFIYLSQQGYDGGWTKSKLLIDKMLEKGTSLSQRHDKIVTQGQTNVQGQFTFYACISTGT